MKQWSGIVSAGGAAILSLLTCAICPACIPLYLGLLGVIGIELGDVHEFIFPVMILFILISLGLMARQIARHHGSWKPFIFATLAALGMGLSAFYEYQPSLYVSIAVFMASILWNKRSLVHHKEHGCC